MQSLRQIVACVRAIVFAVVMTVTLAAGCAVAPEVAIVAVDTRADTAVPAVETIAAACAVWRMRCTTTLDEIGAVVVVLAEDDGHVVGAPKRTLGGQATWRPCRSRLWSVARPMVLAHELGHTLGLHHHDDPANVMYEIVGGDQVTEAQVRRAHAHAHALGLCPGSDPIFN